MSEHTKRTRDAFTFSLGGMTTIASYTVAPAIAHDKINKSLAERLQETQEDQPATAREISSWGRFWLSARRRAA